MAIKVTLDKNDKVKTKDANKIDKDDKLTIKERLDDIEKRLDKLEKKAEK